MGKKLGEAVDCMVQSVNTSDLYSSIVTAHTVSLIASKQDSVPELKPYVIKTQKKQDELLSFLSQASNTSLTDSEFWEDPKTENKEVNLWRWSLWEPVDPESLVNDVNYEIQRVERGKEDEDTVILYFV